MTYRILLGIFAFLRGGVLVIEGNTYGNTDFQQCIDMNGKWRIYEQFWNLIKKERRLQRRRKRNSK